MKRYRGFWCAALVVAAVACKANGPLSPAPPAPPLPPVAPPPAPPSPPPPPPPSPPGPTGPGTGVVFIPPPGIPPFSATDPVVGRYRLALIAGTGCDSYPEIVHRRTYTADIEPTSGTPYKVKLYDAWFLQGLTCHDPRFPQGNNPTCNQFLASRTDDSLIFDFHGQPDDNWNGNLIYEALADGTWIEMAGRATGPINDGNLTAAGELSLSHWLGFPGDRSRYSTCRSSDLRLEFSRR